MKRAYEDFGKANNILDESLFPRPGFQFDLVLAKLNV